MQTATTRIAIASLAALAIPKVAVGQSGDPPPNNDGNVTVFAAVGNEIVSLITTIVVPDLGQTYLDRALHPPPRDYLAGPRPTFGRPALKSVA